MRSRTKLATILAVCILMAASGCTSKPSTQTASGAVYPALGYDLVGVAGADQILELADLERFHLSVFDATSGPFKPKAIITRRIFLRWLFKANNALWSGNDAKQISPATSGDPSAFSDVSSSDPDFGYVQGLQNAGIAVGFSDKTARLDQPLTREQMLAIKSVLDEGPPPPSKSSDIPQMVSELPAWRDKKQISPEFVPAILNSILADSRVTSSQRIDNVGRVFGAARKLHPKQPVTRAQAAVLLWRIGDRSAASVIDGRDDDQTYASVGPDIDPNASRRLASLGDRISGATSRLYGERFAFFVVGYEVVNAKAIASRVYVNQGMLAYVGNNADELAGPLCHETWHAVHHDNAASHAREDELYSIEDWYASKLERTLRHRLDSTIGKAKENGRDLLDRHYDRADETRADLRGSEICARAGYNPWGMIWLLRKMNADPSMNTKASWFSYLKSDPLGLRRSNRASNLARIRALKLHLKTAFSYLESDYVGFLESNHPSFQARIKALERHFAQNRKLFGRYHDAISHATPLVKK